MQEWLIQTIAHYPHLVYGALILIAAAEGPILSILLGVLIKLGIFSFAPSYAAVIAGDVISDIGWYYIGKSFGYRFVRRFGKYIGVTEEKVEHVKRIFHKYNFPILFVSKITNGFGLSLVILLTAGIVRIPFLRFVTVNFVGQFIWSGLLIAAGYFFSGLYIQADSFIGKASIVVLFILIAAIFLGFANYLRKRAEQ